MRRSLPFLVLLAATAALFAFSPPPEADGRLLRPLDLTYRSMLEMRGDELEIELSRTVSQALYGSLPVWRVVDVMVTPRGTSIDTFDVDRQTLRPIRRHATGMGTMRLQYGPERVTGEITGNGRTIPVDVPLEAPVVGDGPGVEVFVMGLPLSEGYQTTLIVFTPLADQGQPLRLAVTGTETIEVPAGRIDTYRLELGPVAEERGGPSIRMNVTKEAPHIVVRGTYELPPQVGGGAMTTELVARN